MCTRKILGIIMYNYHVKNKEDKKKSGILALILEINMIDKE